MQIGVIGLNHKCADINLREKILKACQKNLSGSLTSSILQSFVLLITCNRVEIYYSSTELTKAHAFLLKILRTELAISFEHKLYSFFRWDCFRHLCEVTAGLDSAVLAETEIQGQVKNAYREASAICKLSSDMHFLFQKSLQTGKKVRTHCLALESGCSFERTVKSLIQSHSFCISSSSVLFVGASDINLSLVSYLKQEGLGNAFLCNRTASKGQRLAKKWGVNWISWQALHLWAQFDVVIFATKCPTLLVEHELPSFSSDKKLILDLSVPRNVAPGVKKDPRIALYNMDQVNKLVCKDRVLSKDALFKAREQIQVSTGRYIQSYRNRNNSSAVLAASM